ncbi:uncharacterized protein LOC128229262 [Mya arenaria]|uniref:uncharacterized protein LOC128229262 n=1 Tax=Mya arenaria TaxID=6604 RepID=UPI0022E6441C|nr:uncharacterized protein LOC128229262 [Mya arenaria]
MDFSWIKCVLPGRNCKEPARQPARRAAHPAELYFVYANMPTCSSLVAVATGEFSRTRTSAGKNVVSCGFPYRHSARISEKGILSPNHDVPISSS